MQIDDSDAEREKKRRAMRKQVEHPYITRQYIEVPRRRADNPPAQRVDPSSDEGNACDRDD